jgi:hypothetical protein
MKSLFKKISLGIFLCIIFSFNTSYVSASEADNISGWAWSPNIGWISMNCTTGSATGGDICDQSNYGVSFQNGLWSGYAWNPHVGWISFNPSDTAVCSPTSNAPFARVLSASSDGEIGSSGYTDSFDGCISIKSLTKGDQVAYSSFEKIKSRLARSFNMYNLFKPEKAYASSCFAIDGSAWGSHVVGWISFSQVRLCDTGDGINDFVFQANPERISGNVSTDITLSYIANPITSNFDSCTASARDENGNTISLVNWSGLIPSPSSSSQNISVSVPVVSGTVSNTPRIAATYILNCTVSSGSTVERIVRVYRYDGISDDRCTINPADTGCTRRSGGTGKGRFQEQ